MNHKLLIIGVVLGFCIGFFLIPKYTPKSEAAMLEDHTPQVLELSPRTTTTGELRKESNRVWLRNMNRIFMFKNRTVRQTRAVMSPPPSRRRGFNTCKIVNLGLGNGYRGDALLCN